MISLYNNNGLSLKLCYLENHSSNEQIEITTGRLIIMQKNLIYILELASLPFFIACILTFAHSAFASGFATSEPEINRTTNQMVGYWDLRERNSFFQVTNKHGEDIRIHIQIFNVGEECQEYDYYDTFTGFDTHVYNLAELDRNNGAALAAPDFSGGHGIIAVSHVNGDDSLNIDRVLTGNFRVVDTSGYEYRVNFAGTGQGIVVTDLLTNTVNFNETAGSKFSDLIVINYVTTFEPGGIQPTSREYSVVLYDERENPVSCSPMVLGCSEGFNSGSSIINTGINQGITNSRSGPSLCLGNDNTGFVEILTTSGDFIIPEFVIVYSGLNNGNRSGSMIIANQKLAGEELDIPDECDIIPELCQPPP